jgi:hypothetical protein
MPEEAKKIGASTSVKLNLFAIAAFVAVFGIYMIARAGSGGIMEVTPGGGVKVSFNKNDSLSDLLAKAIQADEDAGKDTVEDLLRGEGYYRLNNTHWVNDIRSVDLDNDVKKGARKLLFDLAGPFAPAGEALDGADDRLLDAVDQLMDAARKIEPDSNLEANAFLAAIWKASLERTGIFKSRSLLSDVTRIFAPVAMDGDRFVIYACVGSPLEGKEISLVYNRADLEKSYSTRALVKVDPIRFDSCKSEKNLKQLLANQKARLRFPEEGFRSIYGPVGEGETLPPRIDTKIFVLPNQLTQWVPPPLPKERSQ